MSLNRFNDHSSKKLKLRVHISPCFFVENNHHHDPFDSVTRVSVSSSLQSANFFIPPDPFDSVARVSVSSSLQSANFFIPPDPFDSVARVSVSSSLQSASFFIPPDSLLSTH